MGEVAARINELLSELPRLGCVQQRAACYKQLDAAISLWASFSRPPTAAWDVLLPPDGIRQLIADCGGEPQGLSSLAIRFFGSLGASGLLKDLPGIVAVPHFSLAPSNAAGERAAAE